MTSMVIPLAKKQKKADNFRNSMSKFVYWEDERTSDNEPSLKWMPMEYRRRTKSWNKKNVIIRNWALSKKEVIKKLTGTMVNNAAISRIEDPSRLLTNLLKSISNKNPYTKNQTIWINYRSLRKRVDKRNKLYCSLRCLFGFRVSFRRESIKTR